MTTPPPTKDLRRSLTEISQLAAQLKQAPATEGTVRSLEQLASLRKQVRETLRQRGQLPPALTASSAIQDSTPTPQGVDPAKPLTMDAIGRYMIEASRFESGRRNVVRTVAQFPDERLLTDDGFANIEKINKLQATARQPEELESLTAALCQPLEPRYDVQAIGTQERPIRDGLLRFGVDRGGIRYRPSLAVDYAAAGVGVWTEADDDADPLVPKSCLDIDCPATQEATVHAIYACLTVRNFTVRFDRELATAVVNAALVAQAARAENELLTALQGGSTTVTFTGDLGMARDVLEALDRAAAYLRSRHRLTDGTALRWTAPRWVLDALRADVVRQHAGGGLEAFELAERELLNWFAVRQIRPTWHLDGAANQQFADATAGNPLPDYPSMIDSVLAVEGDWLHLDGGTMDLGLVRDSTLNSENRAQVFAEDFETTAFLGAESLRLQVTSSVTGLSAGTSPA
ncbi:major capsid protein [Haloechinothrix salitolerans]|uniref:Major capsid protein n=1 Tax=Haloechinothrix salitolerans TaxID=926830 RepID=A0ABW2C759_9PSEU